MTVFISHSSHDHAAVRSLIQHLQTGHESVWLDQSLIGGEAWWQRILHQIRSCTVFIVALSNSCLQSKPCRAEIDYAKALGLPILPVIIGDVDSYRIDPIFTVQSVDFRNPDAASAAALIAAVRERAAERKELPDPLPPPPPVPYEYLQRLGVAIDSPEELSPTEQTTILADLRHALRQEDDESVREDIRRLLGALRRRSEITHGNVEEIDDLLARYPTTRTEPTPPPWQPQPQPQPQPMPAPPPPPPWPQPPKPAGNNRKALAIAAGAAAILIAVIVVVAFLVTGHKSTTSTATKPTTTTPPPPQPLPVAALDGLLLTPDQINTAMGATAMTVDGGTTYSSVQDDSAVVSDRDCVVMDGAAEPAVYAGSGWIAMRGQTVKEPGDSWTHSVHQEVVSFASANDAAAFFSTSTQRWPACANRKFTVTLANTPATVWTVGPVSDTNGTLSVTKTVEGGDGYACQRALTVRNNVAVDVSACSNNPADSGVNIAHQIAAKVDRQ
jgi:serine/threonine kinase PknH